jgi:peptidoglycan biosynthesis protein MviN/MurJ (putative lipid II flippase)
MLAYARLCENESEERTLMFTNNSLGVSVALNMFLMLVLQVGGLLILRIIGFGAEQSSTALTATRVLLLQLLLAAMLNLFVGYLTARKSFIGPNIIGFPLNVTVITICLLMGTQSGVVDLTLAYLLALAAQIIVLSFWLPKEKYRFQLSVRFDTPEIKSSLNLMISVLIGGAVAELDAWADVTSHRTSARATRRLSGSWRAYSCSSGF